MEEKRKNKGRPSISSDVKAVVVRMYNQNVEIDKIGSYVGISRASVFRIMKEARLNA